MDQGQNQGQNQDQTKDQIKDQTQDHPQTQTPASRTPATNRVVALLLMLPDRSDDPLAAAGPTTYRISLGAGMTEARVEIDGRSIGTTRVQRVSPEAPVAGEARAAGLPRISSAVPRPAVSATASTASPSDGLPRERTARRVPVTVVRTLPAVQQVVLNPNGAPIID